MRIVVYPHVMEIGGSQLNAIELAARVRDLGHDVVVFGQPGALVERVDEMGVEFIAAPPPSIRPTPGIVRALNQLARRRAIDVVHGYEWTSVLEAYWGPRMWLGVPAVATVMSMAVAPFLPYDVPLVVGTEQIAAHERDAGRPDVHLIEPPVDLRHNAPELVAAATFRREWNLDPDAVSVVTVTRLVAELKREGLLAAIDTIERLPAGAPRAQLVIVGDGPVREEIEKRAAVANARTGRRAVVLTGELTDPRAAYAAADISLGMGGSALRAMAFGVPLVVQGERGFWEVLSPETAAQFLWTGWYGVGDGSEHGPTRLERHLLDLLSDAERRERLGQYARTLVEERFSLDHAARMQLEIYERAVERPAGRRAALRWGAASAWGLFRHEAARRIGGRFGEVPRDDFNARPVAGKPSRSAASERSGGSGRAERAQLREGNAHLPHLE